MAEKMVWRKDPPTEPGWYWWRIVDGDIVTDWEITKYTGELMEGNCVRYGPRIPDYDPDAIPVERFAACLNEILNSSQHLDHVNTDDIWRVARRHGLLTGEGRAPGWPKLEDE